MLPSRVPPTPAAMKAMAQAAAYTKRALTPTDRAAISSSAVACMASPQRVYLKKQTKTTSRMMAAIKLHR